MQKPDNVKYNCNWCKDTGQMPADVFDQDSGQYMRGVGLQRCGCDHEDHDD